MTTTHRGIRMAALAASVSLLPLAAAAPALAQDGQGAASDVITVTAQRREQSLQDVPLSVTAYTGEQLEELGAVNITAITETTPNVTLEVSRATNTTLTAFIRGVGQQDPVAGFEAGVGIYVDDVYLNRPQAAVLDIYDVERIEVLRGPQGSLYGRNTIGGAVKYVTRRLDPDEMTLNARINVGSYNQFDQIISGSTPIGEHFRIGGAVANLTRDGFGENLLTGQDNYNKDVFAWRASAEWEPNDFFFMRVSADRIEDDSNPRQGHRLIPGGLSGAPVLDDEFDTRAGLGGEQTVVSEGFSVLTEVQINDNWMARNIIGVREDESFSPIDFDSLPAPDLDVPVIYENEQFSEEFQLLYEGERLNGLIGAYYLNANAFNVFDVLLAELGAIASLPGLNAQTLGDVDTETWSVFADFTYDFSDEWALTLGGRYTDDERTSRVLRTTYLFGFSPTFGGTGVPVAVTSDFLGSNEWSDFSPRVSLSYAPDDTHNFYFTYSQGFKGGGFDPRAQTSGTPDFNLDSTISADEIFQFMSFEPEEVDSFELGWKLAADGYRHSLAIFYTDYTDIQVPGSVGIDTNGDGTNDSFTGVTTNAGAANILGIEYEGFAELSENIFKDGDELTATWSVGVLDGEYTEFIDAFGIDISDEVEIQNTPSLTASATAAYRTPWAGGELAVLNTISYRGGSQQFERPSPIDQDEGFTLWNMSAVWESGSGRWQAGVHGRNLTDERYRVAGYDFVTYTSLGLEGTLTGFYGDPRTVTGTIAYRY